MLLQTNSYVVPREKRNEHARLLRRFRQTLLRLGCDHFEVYEQVGANWSADDSISRFVQILRFVDRKHQLAVQAAERTDPTAQAVIAEFCEMINFPIQQEKGLFAVGYYTSVLPYAPRRDSQGEVVSTVDQEGDPAPMQEPAAGEYTSEAEYTEVPDAAAGIESDLLGTPSEISGLEDAAAEMPPSLTAEMSPAELELPAVDQNEFASAPVENTAATRVPELSDLELFEPEEIAPEKAEVGPADDATEPAPIDLQAELGEPIELFDPIADEKPLESFDDLSALEDLEALPNLEHERTAEMPAELPVSEHATPADPVELPPEILTDEPSIAEHSSDLISAERHSSDGISSDGLSPEELSSQGHSPGLSDTDLHLPEHFSLDDVSLEAIPADLHEPIEEFQPAEHVESFAPAVPAAEPAPVEFAATPAPIEPIIPDSVMPMPPPLFADAEPAVGQLPASDESSIFDTESTNGHEPPPPPELPGAVAHDESESHRWVTPVGDAVVESSSMIEPVDHHLHSVPAEPIVEDDLPELLTEEYVPEPLDDDFDIDSMAEPGKAHVGAEDSTESNGLIEAELVADDVFEGTWEPSSGHTDQPHVEKTDGGHREPADQPHGW